MCECPPWLAIFTFQKAHALKEQAKMHQNQSGDKDKEGQTP